MSQLFASGGDHSNLRCHFLLGAFPESLDWGGCLFSALLRRHWFEVV